MGKEIVCPFCKVIPLLIKVCPFVDSASPFYDTSWTLRLWTSDLHGSVTSTSIFDWRQFHHIVCKILFPRFGKNGLMFRGRGMKSLVGGGVVLTSTTTQLTAPLQLHFVEAHSEIVRSVWIVEEFRAVGVGEHILPPGARPPIWHNYELLLIIFGSDLRKIAI